VGCGQTSAESFAECGLGSRVVATQALPKDSKVVEYSLALLVVDWGLKRWLESRIWRWGRRSEADAADVEIFLEPVELEEVGKFQSADISALCTDFPLKISNYALQVCGVKAGLEELKPEPFAIEAQAESLSSPVAVKFVEFAYRFEPAFCVLG